MPQLTKSQTYSGLGMTIAKSVARTGDGGSAREITLAAGKAGTLSTRTDNTTGTLTLGSGHGITTGASIDVYWAGGVQYKVTVGTVAGTSVPISLGVGDNLPAQDTAVVACVRTQINLDIDGDELELLAICPEFANTAANGAAVHVDFQDSASAEIAELDFQGNVPREWDIAGGATNSFTGNPITKAFASNGSSAYDATLKLVWVQDSTP